jgi:hypothetical protein
MIWDFFTAGRTASTSYRIEAHDYRAAYKIARAMFPHLHSSCIRIERS